MDGAPGAAAAAGGSRIRTGFTARTTAEDVAAGHDLSGLRAVVTGGASGIGRETARVLAAAGASVTLAVRDTVAARLVAAVLPGRVAVAHLDLAEPRSVDAFAAAWTGPLHLLVNNAGIMRLPALHRTPDGVELQLATNHLGHFLLARHLHAALAAGAAGRGSARVVAVSSRAHLDAPVDLDDLSFERHRYDPVVAYAQSKTANVLFAVEATRRWLADGIVPNALNPGGVRTNLQRHLPSEVQEAMRGASSKTVEQGAATTLVASIAPEFAHVGGRYLEDADEADLVPDDAPPTSGVRGYALDPQLAQRLWDVSAQLV